MVLIMINLPTCLAKVKHLLDTMNCLPQVRDDVENADLWLDRTCLVQLRDLGMDSLLKGPVHGWINKG